MHAYVKGIGVWHIQVYTQNGKINRVLNASCNISILKKIPSLPSTKLFLHEVVPTISNKHIDHN